MKNKRYIIVEEAEEAEKDTRICIEYIVTESDNVDAPVGSWYIEEILDEDLKRKIIADFEKIKKN